MKGRALIEVVEQGLAPSELLQEITHAGGRVDVALFIGPILTSFITQYDAKQSR
jgi:hypothetical protein